MSDHDHDADDEKVGYGKPPKKHQFQPGQSGNRKGRPKGSKGMRTLFVQELKRKITVTEGGKTRTMSRAEAIVLQNIRRALNGDPKLLSVLLGIDREHYPTDLQIGSSNSNREPDDLEQAEITALVERIRGASNGEARPQADRDITTPNPSEPTLDGEGDLL